MTAIPEPLHGKVRDTLNVSRVANGWVVRTGRELVDEFSHVYQTPDTLAEHVRKWAVAQEAFVEQRRKADQR